MLIKELRTGDSFKIGDATITMVKKSGQVARLAISADKTIPITDVKKQQQKEKPVK